MNLERLGDFKQLRMAKSTKFYQNPEGLAGGREPGTPELQVGV